MGYLTSFWFGLTLPLRAFRLICANRQLWPMSLLPMLITAVAFGFFFFTLHEHARAWIEGLYLSQGWDPSTWTATLLRWAGNLLLLLLGALVFSSVAGVIASPFNDFLAEKTEKLSTPPLPPAPTQGWRQLAKTIGIDVLKSVVTFFIGLGVLILAWIPVLNLGAFLLTALLLAFQFISYPQTRRGQRIRDGFQFILSHPLACMGFGATLSVLFAIPLIASLALPTAVVGGTLLYARAKLGELK